jgi:hypothetical protein
VADTDGTQKTWSFRANKAGAGVLQEEDIVEETDDTIRCANAQRREGE